MKNESYEPQPPVPATRTCSTPHSAPVGWLKTCPEPVEATHPPTAAPPDTPQPPAFPATRHDGWTGERIATFCEALAETAVVAEACDAAGMGLSGAYAARRRNPIFAAAWEAALTIARERLADTLLARAMEGNIEQIWRDGEIVGERHVLDNRLGLAILRRLDRLAETGLSLHSNPVPFAGAGRGPGAAQQRSLASRPIDWNLALDALRLGDDDGVAKALALVKSYEVEEVEDPPIRPPSASADEGDEPHFLDLSDRCWRGHDPDGDRGEMWMTDFPPPEGFDGYENRPYDEDDDDEEAYERACTPEEVAILDADIAADRAAEREDDEQLRDEWFDTLRANLMADEDDQPDGDSDRQQLDEPPPAHAGSAIKAATRKKPGPAAG